MKVVILGAGVMGVTVAHALWRRGHQVHVLERREGPALETSFANAGGLCPGFAGPWAAPGMPWKVAKWMLQATAPLAIRPRLDPAQWRWLCSFLGNCTPQRFQRNKLAMQRIAHYSLACLRELREELALSYDGQAAGVLQVFRSEEELERGARAARVLAELGVAHRLIDAAGVYTIEPALRSSALPFVGGLHLPDDETGDCHLFTQKLATVLESEGVIFHYRTTVRGLAVETGRFRGVITDSGLINADACVVALGAHAPALMVPLGIRLPIYPVKGYSLTAEISNADQAPHSCVMDERSKIMVTRLGNRLRAAGVAELAGFDAAPCRRTAETLCATTAALFPQAAKYRRLPVWTGFRPMTPDGPPYLGETPVRHLYLNVGQGSNGWTQACGSARVVADILSGRSPEIDVRGMTLASRSAAAQ